MYSIKLGIFIFILYVVFGIIIFGEIIRSDYLYIWLLYKLFLVSGY